MELLDKMVEEDYRDDFTLTKQELMEYNFDETFLKVQDKLRDLKKARNRFINGYHVRVTSRYQPRLEAYTHHVSDNVGTEVEYRLDSEKEYNEFNYQLNRLYETMSKPEIAFINDCLLCNRSEASVRDKFGISRDGFVIIKQSSVVRFAIAFNIVVYN